jgi:HEAT repeat protein
LRALGKRGPGIFPKQFRQLLEDESGDRIWPGFVTWVERASAADLVAAYSASRNAAVRGFICYRVGWRGLRAATPILVAGLDDPDTFTRYAAADALGKFGDPSTGPDFWKRFAVEDDPGVRGMLILGLIATGQRAIIPVLIETIADPEPCRMQAEAAWGLNVLGAVEALPALHRALAVEQNGWARGVIRETIGDLTRLAEQQPTASASTRGTG